MKALRASLLLGSVIVALIALGGSAGAAEPGPGWELYAASYPTNLGQGVDEVQQVTATGEFTLSYEGVATGPLKEHASAAEVQAALEALSTIGAHDVGVTSGAPGQFTIAFGGALGNMQVAKLVATGASVEVTTAGLASGTLGVHVFNVGASESTGTITVTDTLPVGVKAKRADALFSPGLSGNSFGGAPAFEPGIWDCTGNNASAPAPHVAGATVVTCTNDPSKLERFAGGGGTLTFASTTGNLQPEIGIAVEAEPGAEGTKAGAEGNHVTISGGGAAGAASAANPITIGGGPPKGGLAQADAWLSNVDGTVDTQAGSHPYEATFVFDVATALNAKHKAIFAGGQLRNLETQVPPGLVGDLHTVPQCTRAELFTTKCPPASMIGRITVQSLQTIVVDQVFNLVPSPGVPAEIGFNYGNVPVYISFSVKSGSDYGIVAHVNDIPRKEVYESILTLWGVPGDSSHDIWRYGNNGCRPGSGPAELEGPPFNGANYNYCRRPVGASRTPILRLPTSCAGPQPYVFRELAAWQEPEARSEVAFASHDASGAPAGFSGCEGLGTEPAFALAPEVASTDTPSGFTAEVSPALGGLEIAEALAPADIERARVTLPEGLVINPGQAAGLQACPAGRPSAGQFGDALTTAQETAEGSEDNEAPSCPAASKIGTATITSPPLEADSQKQLEGDIYVLASNPPDVRLLVAASADGVNVKLVGTAHLNEQTGRVETVFENTPQLPFTHFKLSFPGGARAPLATPVRCGARSTEADFAPWSAPAAADSLRSSAFALTEGPGGGSCPGSPLPFGPTLVAGTTSAQAGAFTTLTTQLQRGDGQQRVERLRITTPAGLAGMISSVPLCPEAQAQLGTCPESSSIGHATVTSGPGPNPLTIPQPGDPAPTIYLTGPYAGAPFGLSIVTRVLAGPFDLGTIVTRAKIEVDPTTAQVTITTDPLPQIVKGVPTDLRSISAVIERQNFIFNPTSCEPQAITGTAWGTAPPGGSEAGQAAGLSSHFAVGSCGELPFKPSFSVATSGKTSKAGGASLTVRVAQTRGEANIHKVNLQLPLQLPSRLTTLQKACTAAQFESNPAGCPEGSLIGTATAHTPVLNAPLTGPAYLVSHGNAAFPDVEFLLQGEGVKIVLDGKTDIKKGITYSRFETVPDAPISSFEVTLPEGPHSALAAPGGNLCGHKLVAPTLITGQNGAQTSQSTRIQVEGCAKTLTVVSKSLRKRTLTLRVYAPGAGRVTASGPGLSRGSKAYSGQEDQTFTLTQIKRGRHKAKVELLFTPAKGARQAKTLVVTFRT